MQRPRDLIELIGAVDFIELIGSVRVIKPIEFSGLIESRLSLYGGRRILRRLQRLLEL